MGLSSQSLEDCIAQYSLDLDSLDYLGNTALIWATQRNDIAAVRTLLNAGANPNIQNSAGSSALFYASACSTLPCVSLLICAGSDLDLLNHYGDNALHALIWQRSSVHSEQRALIRYLVSVGVDVNQRDKWGSTPLAHAAQYKLPVLAAALLDCGADIDSQDNDGDNAIHNAMHYNSEEVIRLLLSRGATYATWISTGNSLFHLAASNGSLNTIDILLAARLKDVDPDAQNRQGYTALELAEQRERTADGFVEKVRLLLADVRSRNARIALGIDSDADSLSTRAIPSIPLQNSRNSARAQVQGDNRLRRLTRSLCMLLTQIEMDLPRRLGLILDRWNLPFIGRFQSILSIQAMVLGLGFAVLALWIYLISRLRWVRLALEMAWSLLGPGGFEL